MPKQFACHFAAVDVAVSAAVGVVVCWLSLNPAASSWGTPPWSGILLGPQLCFLACCTLKGKQGKGVLGPYSIYLSFLCKQKWPFSIWTYSNPFGSQLLWDTCWIFHMVEDLASTSASLSERRVKSSWKYKFCTSRYLDEKYEELKHLLWSALECSHSESHCGLFPSKGSEEVGSSLINHDTWSSWKILGMTTDDPTTSAHLLFYLCIWIWANTIYVATGPSRLGSWLPFPCSRPWIIQRLQIILSRNMVVEQKLQGIHWGTEDHFVWRQIWIAPSPNWWCLSSLYKTSLWICSTIRM